MKLHLLGLLATVALPAVAFAQAITPGNTSIPQQGDLSTLMSTQNSDNVRITGGTIGVNNLSASNLYGSNIVQNGDFYRDGRNEGAAVFLPDDFGVKMVADRFSCVFNSAGSGATGPSAQRIPSTFAGLTGAPYELKVTFGAAGSVVPSGLIAGCAQAFDAQDVADLQWGTGNALPVSLSLQIKASVPGIYYVALLNSYQNAAGTVNGGAGSYPSRSYSAPCSVAQAGVQAPCVISNIPGDVAAGWSNAPNTIGGALFVTLDAGAAYQGTPGNGSVASWQAGFLPAASTQAHPSLVAGATVELAIVKVERGLVATPGFPPETGGVLPIKLGRFYSKTFSDGVAPAAGAGKAGAVCAEANFIGSLSNMKILQYQITPFPPMFGAPTVLTYNPTDFFSGSAWQDFTSIGTMPILVDPFGVRNGKSILLVGSSASVGNGDLVCGHYTLDSGY